MIFVSTGGYKNNYPSKTVEYLYNNGINNGMNNGINNEMKKDLNDDFNNQNKFGFQ